MDRHLIYIIFSALMLLSASFLTSAQTVREGSEEGNMILTAVGKYNDRDIKGAVAILQEVIAADPENDAAWYYIAQCAIASDDLEMAEQGLRMASEIDPDNFWYRYRLARL